MPLAMSQEDRLKLEESRRQVLGIRIDEARKRKHMTLLNLADKTILDEKTIRNAIDGKRTNPATIAKICQILEIDEDEGEEHVALSKETHGAYMLSHYQDYIGFFFCYRRAFANPKNILRSVYELRWRDEKDNECLVFSEMQAYQSQDQMRKIDYSQSGEVYISNTTGLMQLLTSHKGALRLITLTKMRLDDMTMHGAVLTQAQRSFYYQPSISPIFFQKTDPAVSLDDLTKAVGPMKPGEAHYDMVSEYLAEIERNIAIFALSPGAGRSVVPELQLRIPPVRAFGTPTFEAQQDQAL